MKKKGLSIGNIATYSCGALGREFSANCVNAFFLVYLCIYQGLNPLILTVAFVLAKVWDAINDPILATIINNSKRSRFGRFRPWILAGVILNAACLVLMFMPIDAPSSAKYVYYIGLYVAWGMSYTLTDVPFWSMLPTIANTTEERNKASSMARLIGGFGGFLVGMLGTSFVLPVFSGSGIMKAYIILGGISGLIMFAFVIVMVIGNKENYEIPDEKTGLKEIFQMFKENDQLRAYAGELSLFLMGTTLSLSQLLYLYVYCYQDGANFLSSSYSYTMFWIIACTGQGIAMFFYNLLTRKIPREKIYGLAFYGCVISYLLMYGVFFILKDGAYFLNSILVALSGAFLMTSSGINQIGSTVMIADIVDYGEYKTGKRADAILFSVQTLLYKIAGAVAMLVLGIGITVAGLPSISDLPITDKNGVYQETLQVFTDDNGNYLIKDKEKYEKATSMEEYENKIIFVEDNIISPKSLNILRIFMFLIPIPLTIGGYIIYKKKYRLYGNYYDDIKASIDLRRK